MARSRSSSFQGKRCVAAAYQVSPSRMNGVPSSYSKAWPLADGLTKPRRVGTDDFSASDQPSAVKPPFWLFKPESFWFDPLRQDHLPGRVARMRTRKTSSPAQNP